MEKRFIGNCTLMLSCPKVRAILASLTSADLSTQMFPWLSAQEIEVAGIPVGAMPVSFVGESGWELHDPIAAQVRLATALFDSGKNYRSPGLACVPWTAGASKNVPQLAQRLEYRLQLDRGWHEALCAVAA